MNTGWHGVNLWLHKQLCTPVPSCSAVKDPNYSGGNSGYVLDFMNRDGGLTTLKEETPARNGPAATSASLKAT